MMGLRFSQVDPVAFVLVVAILPSSMTRLQVGRKKEIDDGRLPLISELT